MAEVSTNMRSKVETVTVEKVVSYQEVRLILDEEEAQLLADLLYKVGGSPTVSRRKYVGAVARALGVAGIHPSGCGDIEGNLYIHDSEIAGD